MPHCWKSHALAQVTDNKTAYIDGITIKTKLPEILFLSNNNSDLGHCRMACHEFLGRNFLPYLYIGECLLQTAICLMVNPA